MSKLHHFRSDIAYQLPVSFLGLFLVVAFAVFPPTVGADFFWRKPVIGSIFSSICVLGVLAVFSPHKCGKIFNLRKTEGNSVQFVSHETSTTLQGHHPTCGNYCAYTIQVNGKTVCAACNGLLVGGLLALVVSFAYFFVGFSVAGYSSLMVLLGVLGVSLGLFQFRFRCFVRLSVNAVFVLGAFLILAGVDGLVQSLFFDLFVVCLLVFWLFTRIRLSQWNHERICSSCGAENCGFNV